MKIKYIHQMLQMQTNVNLFHAQQIVIVFFPGSPKMGRNNIWQIGAHYQSPFGSKTIIRKEHLIPILYVALLYFTMCKLYNYTILLYLYR